MIIKLQWFSEICISLCSAFSLFSFFFVEDLSHSHRDIVFFSTIAKSIHIESWCSPVSMSFLRHVNTLVLRRYLAFFKCYATGFVERRDIIKLLTEKVCFASQTVRGFAQTLHDPIFKLLFETLVVTTAKDVIWETVTIHYNDISILVFDCFESYFKRLITSSATLKRKVVEILNWRCFINKFKSVTSYRSEDSYSGVTKACKSKGVFVMHLHRYSCGWALKSLSCLPTSLINVVYNEIKRLSLMSLMDTRS